MDEELVCYTKGRFCLHSISHWIFSWCVSIVTKYKTVHVQHVQIRINDDMKKFSIHISPFEGFEGVGIKNSRWSYSTNVLNLGKFRKIQLPQGLRSLNKEAIHGDHVEPTFVGLFEKLPWNFQDFCTFTLSINIANNWQGHTCAICLNVFSFCLTMKDNPVTIMGLRFLVGLFCFPSGERCSSLLGKSDFEGKILALPRKGGRILMMKIFADLTICKKMTLLFRPLVIRL